VGMRVPLFSPDGATLALGENGGMIRLIDWQTRQEREIPAPSPDSGGVTALAFSPDGRILASGYGYSDRTIRLWDVASCKPWAPWRVIGLGLETGLFS